MAEGMSRTDALALLKEDGADDAIRLPARERPLIRLVLATVGQWRIVAGLGGGGRVAFDMTAVDVVARWLGIQPSPQLFEGLSVIEREALRLQDAKS